MEYLSARVSGCRQRRHREAASVRGRVALGGGDHAHGALIVPGHRCLGKAARGHGPQQFRQVGGKQRHQHLGLRVAETYVELQDARALFGHHDPDEQHAAVQQPVGAQSAYRRLHDLRVDRRRQVAVDPWHRAHGAHPAGVGAGVAVLRFLVVAADRQHRRSAAVHQQEQRQLETVQVLFREHRAAGQCAGAESEQCLAVVRLQHALALGKTVHFQNQGAGMGGQNPLQRRPVMHLVGLCRRNLVAPQKRLAERLARLQPGRER